MGVLCSDLEEQPCNFWLKNNFKQFFSPFPILLPEGRSLCHKLSHCVHQCVCSRSPSYVAVQYIKFKILNLISFFMKYYFTWQDIFKNGTCIFETFFSLLKTGVQMCFYMPLKCSAQFLYCYQNGIIKQTLIFANFSLNWFPYYYPIVGALRCLLPRNYSLPMISVVMQKHTLVLLTGLIKVGMLKKDPSLSPTKD